MKITRLEAENFKRLTAVTINPDGSLVVVGGRNGAGKSSTLDAIEAALGGTKSAPSEPIRKGAGKARVVVETDTLVVTRTFSGTGSKLVVTGRDGAKVASPQALLDSLVGPISFDPQAFSRLPAKLQADTLRRVIGLDLTEIDAKRAHAYDERTEINREHKRTLAQAQGFARHEGVPDVEVSVVALAAELDRMREANAANERARADVTHRRQAHASLVRENEAATQREGRAESEAYARIVALEQQIKREREGLDGLTVAHRHAAEQRRHAIEDANAGNDTAAKHAAGLIDSDASSVRAQIDAAETTNARVRENRRRAEAEAVAAALANKSDDLTGQIETLDAERARLITSARYPIAGLEVDSEGVRFAGVPLAQASSAQQLRVATAIGLALNPELKVILIRDGSLLDEDSLAMVARMAEEADAQVWIERVGRGSEVGIVIEDGAVSEDRTEGRLF